MSTHVHQTQEEYYAGIATRHFDLLKELTILIAIIGILVIAAAAFLSSPDIPPVTVQSWAHDDPVDFVTTATGELAGSTTSAGYGVPYQDGTDSAQKLGPISPQAWAGAGIKVNPADEFVLTPLRGASIGNPDLTAALKSYDGASEKDRSSWLDAYTKALGDAKVTNGAVTVAAGDYGPLPVMMSSLLDAARAGALDGSLLNSGRFYQTDFTRPLLFLADGGHLAGLASDQHLAGNQWGMMNETGQYPGQTWLWLYTLPYQLPFFQGDGVFAKNADLVVVLMIAILTILLALVPFIPGLRDIPRWIPIHRLIWRRPRRRPAASANRTMTTS